MTSAYYFAFATILAVIPILVLFKLNLDKLKENPEDVGKIQTKFFIGIAIAETIPLFLIVLGLMDLTPASSIEELAIPGGIVILAMLFAPFFIFMQRAVDVTEESKQVVTTFSMLALGLANAVPIISIVGLIMLLP